MTASPVEAPDDPPKLQFHGKSALRKRPSTHSAPIGYTNNGHFLFSFESKTNGRLGISAFILPDVFKDGGVSLSKNITLSTEERGNRWVVTDSNRKQAYDIRKEGTKLNVYKRTKLEILPSLFSIGLVSEGDLDSGNISEELQRRFEKKRISLSQDAFLSSQEPGKTWSIADNQQKYIIQQNNGQFSISLDLKSAWLQVRIQNGITGWTQRERGTIISPPPFQLTLRQRAKQWLLKLIDKLPAKSSG